MFSCWFSKGYASLLLTLLAAHIPFVYAAINVQVPSSSAPTNGSVVFGNFLGISIEFSFLNQYFGNDTTSTPQPIVNYLSAFKSLLTDIPLRIRIGGNSMDSSQFIINQTEMMVFTDPAANFNDQPVNYGPLVFNVMNTVASGVGGISYLIGLSLRQPNDTMIPQLAATSQQILDKNLDAFILGNEPDLYTSHGNRPGIANYSVFDYVGDYWTVFNALDNTTAGNITSLNKIAGPTICCRWDLATTLQQWLTTFSQQIKYITLQHYPKNNCGMGSPPPELSYYLDHSNTVDLGRWQSPGIQLANQAGKPVIMDEFSTASCGGFPGVSNSFGATLWTVDYALQMASTGYSAAYMHTRERGTTYNLFDYPAPGNNQWSTNPTYYAYFPLLQALQSSNGSRVLDLNVGGSNSSNAGYAIYDSSTKDLYRIVLFNYANATDPVDFSVQQGMVPNTGKNVTIKYLTAPSVNEQTRISWNGTTWAGVGDGKPISSGTDSDISMDCVNGCSVRVPSPGLAVLVVNKNLPNNNSTTTTGGHNSNFAAPSAGPVLSFLIFALIIPLYQ